ncbi:Glycosyltransferase [Quillaja saponaria]|uniref:Glycosyltransferase n=1 Tax=Quillaja saponaria TaxID=32244 RepID=A0AAD7VMJ5_QUISA|nr:Glycosyltransferase [Quillaja saponaria]
MPFYAIGPIFPSGFTKSLVPTSLWSESDCTHWLDTKPNASVLYVYFGSFAHVTKWDIVDIANGLLHGNVNFVWVLHPDIVSSDYVNPLPIGFREAVHDHVMIITWCCQIQVSTHPAIGGFLTHCGWNSILESIWCKVPLLCFPLISDQPTNWKLVVDDWKVGINLTDSRVITKEEISEKIVRLMDGKSGNEYKAAITELRKALENAWTGNGSSQKNMDSFIKNVKAKAQASCGLVSSNK